MSATRENYLYLKGNEIEATNHFLLPTIVASDRASKLYDYQGAVAVLKKENYDHILFGYMGIQEPLKLDAAFDIAYRLMADGFKVTWELRPDQLTDELIERCPEPDHPNAQLFVILLGINFPHLEKIRSYTTVRLHGDFQKMNAGNYCMKADKFIENAIFTPWAAYNCDTYLK